MLIRLFRLWIEIASALAVVDLFDSHSLWQVLRILAENDLTRLGFGAAVALSGLAVFEIVETVSAALGLGHIIELFRRILRRP